MKRHTTFIAGLISGLVPVAAIDANSTEPTAGSAPIKFLGAPGTAAVLNARGTEGVQTAALPATGRSEDGGWK